MSARSAVITRYEAADPIRVQIGATTRTFTEGQYLRLMALLNESAADVPRRTALRYG